MKTAIALAVALLASTVQAQNIDHMTEVVVLMVAKSSCKIGVPKTAMIMSIEKAARIEDMTYEQTVQYAAGIAVELDKSLRAKGQFKIWCRNIEKQIMGDA